MSAFRGREQRYGIRYYSPIRSYQLFRIHAKIHAGNHAEIHVEIHVGAKIVLIVSDRTVILDTMTHQKKFRGNIGPTMGHLIKQSYMFLEISRTKIVII